METAELKALYREVLEDLKYDRRQDSWISLAAIAFGVVCGLMFGPVAGVFFGVFLFAMFRLRGYLSMKKPPLLYEVVGRGKKTVKWTGGKQGSDSVLSPNFMAYFDVVDAFTFNESGRVDNRSIRGPVTERIFSPSVYAEIPEDGSFHIVYGSTGTFLGYYVNGVYRSVLRS